MADPAKNTVENYLEPLKPYQEVLSMTSEEKVRAAHEGAGWDKETSDKEVERLQAEGLLDHEGKKIDANIKLMMQQEKKKIDARSAEAYKAIQDRIKVEKENEDKAVVTELGKFKTYKGGKVSQENIQHVINKWNSGAYRKLFKSDATVVAKMIMELEYGAYADEQMRNTKFEEGRGIARKELHNVKSSGDSQGGHHTAGNEKAKGFDQWDALAKASKSGDKVEL
jgi:hypothetical protein